MTLVVDGVRRTKAQKHRPLGESATRVERTDRKERTNAQPISAHTQRASQGVRYLTGIDGVKRVVVPRQASLTSLQATAAGGGYTVTTPVLPLPAWRLPSRGTMRQSALAALAFVMVLASAYGLRSWVLPQAAATQASPASVIKPKPSLAPAVSRHTQAQLQHLIDQFVAANPGHWSIVVKDLSTGVTATYQPDQQMESASLYKLFVAAHIYEQIDLGQLSLAQPAGDGTGRSIQQCLTIMINISDNLCGRALGDILGWGEQNQALEQEGYHQTDLSTPQQTSARDVATLLARLYHGTLISSNSSAQFLTLLKEQQINNRLPAGLPTGTVIAHKTGDLDGYTHDAGIVYGPKTNYVVVVMSGPWGEPGYAPAKFAAISRQIWNYFEE